MTATAPGETVPGIGTFFVGIDVAPGRYRCTEAKGGWWVRFTGPGGGEPVGSWPLPPGPAEVEISPTDFAFETHVASDWERVGAPLGLPARALPGEARPVADPTLRADLDRIVRRGRPLVWFGPLALLALGAGAAALLGAWLVPLALVAVLLWAIVPGVTLDARRARELDRRRDRYVVPEDLDAPALALLARAQRAIDTVLTAEVHREGLLDAIDNAVTLPRQEWEIAQILARQARLRTARDADTVEDEFPEVEAALRPLREKLDQSVGAVTRRVEALERYAERAVAADDALRAQHRLEALTRDAHEYDALLADATRDELAIPAIERLTEQGDALVRALRERLAAAAEAGGDLPLPVDPPAEP
ncbi:hypothetical protein BTM25_30910 [Actinomadura rubteroloni]|uniref:Uncharacterized protein n=1 Tax=Actinomadura rubteroloni TaxID=1926885 RepID=A0A2P4UHC6_9ACTN|nr:hypothetical protein [Actinomadura rubteroloni]POM24462.1 hypothetical protein BTM25_30910 [Actinomadura rubteroloni]